MAASDYVAGYQVAGAGKAQVVDLSAQAAQVAKFGVEQQALTRQKQKEFDDQRAQFKADMAEAYDQYVHENNFDNTGILDFDNATDKLRNEIKNSHLQTEYLYDQGVIDEAEVRRRNNEIKGQVNQVKGLSQQITKFAGDVQTLDEAGKGNAVNDLRTDLLENLSNNFNIVSNENGLQYQTLDKDGNVLAFSAGEFQRILNAEQGVDIEKDLDEIVKLGGLEEKLEGYGRDAKKVTSYLRDSEEGKALLKTRIDQWSSSEKYDYMIQAGLATDDPELARKQGLKLLDASSIFKKEVSEDEEKAIAEHMAEELGTRLSYKETKELYDDKFALEGLRQKGRAALSKEKTIIKSADVELTDDFGNKRRVKEVYPTSGKGIQLDYIVQDPGNNISRSMMEAIEGIEGGIPIPFDAIKKTVFKRQRADVDSGLIEIELGYDYDMKGEAGGESSLVQAIERMSDVNYRKSIRKFGQDAGLSEAEISNLETNKSQGVSFLTDRAPKAGSATFTYVPTNISEYNKIRTATGQEPISNADWSKYIEAKKKSQGWSSLNK
jgi:hypothetical protein